VTERARELFDLQEAATAREIDDFARRHVLVVERDFVRCKVPLFAEWLVAHGPAAIGASSPEAAEQGVESPSVAEQEEAAEARDEASVTGGGPSGVRYGDVAPVVERWGSFLGDVISPERALSWLRQFDGEDQWLMLPILSGLNYFDEAWARERSRVAHRSIRAGTQQQFERARGTEPLRSQAFVVSYFGGDGKSGALLARYYAEENRIHRGRNVFGADRLPSRMPNLSDIQKVIFVDDFVGTGSALEAALEEFERESGDWLRQLDTETHLVVLVGFERGVARVARALERLNLPMKLQVSRELSDQRDRVFSPRSRFFDSGEQREAALRVAEAVGRRLEPRAPLGFGDLQAAVVFDWACPNNTLPMLRKRKGDEWIPLFERSL
jgi:hypothetical protein